MISIQQPNLTRQWSQQVNLWGQKFASSVATTQRQVVSMLVQTHLLTDYRVRQRDYLLKITRAISAQLDIDEVLKLVLQSSVEMLTGQAGLVAEQTDSPGRRGGHFRLAARQSCGRQLRG